MRQCLKDYSCRIELREGEEKFQRRNLNGTLRRCVFVQLHQCKGEAVTLLLLIHMAKGMQWHAMACMHVTMHP